MFPAGVINYQLIFCRDFWLPIWNGNPGRTGEFQQLASPSTQLTHLKRYSTMS